MNLAASQGLEWAQYRLGIIYIGKGGGERNIITAIHWLSQAAAIGNTEAILALGDLAEKGEGGLTDEYAVELYEKMIKGIDGKIIRQNESYSALKRLSVIYQEGRKNVEPNADKAICYLREICRAVLRDESFFNLFRDYSSLYRLGCLLEVQPEEGEAQQAFWCLKNVYSHLSNTKDYPDLELRLGKMCEEGRGTQQDDAQAASYYKIAVRKGNTEAGERLARLHAQGRGLTGFEKMGTKLTQLVGSIK